MSTLSFPIWLVGLTISRNATKISNVTSTFISISCLFTFIDNGNTFQEMQNTGWMQCMEGLCWGQVVGFGQSLFSGAFKYC